MSELVDRVDHATTEMPPGLPPQPLLSHHASWRPTRASGLDMVDPWDAARRVSVRAGANQQPVGADGWLSGLARQTPMPPSETAGAGPTNPGLRPQPPPASRRCAPATRRSRPSPQQSPLPHQTQRFGRHASASARQP